MSHWQSLAVCGWCLECGPQITLVDAFSFEKVHSKPGPAYQLHQLDPLVGWFTSSLGDKHIDAAFLTNPAYCPRVLRNPAVSK